MTKTFIIHQECLNIEIEKGIHAEHRDRQLRVQKELNELALRANNLIVIDDYQKNRVPLDGDVYILVDDPTIRVAECVMSGEKAVFVGAYTERCVAAASENAKRAGAVTSVNKDLTVPMDQRLYGTILK